eukprot:4597611-Amphidinium_carterae.2
MGGGTFAANPSSIVVVKIRITCLKNHLFDYMVQDQNSWPVLLRLLGHPKLKHQSGRGSS